MNAAHAIQFSWEYLDEKTSSELLFLIVIFTHNVNVIRQSHYGRHTHIFFDQCRCLWKDVTLSPRRTTSTAINDKLIICVSLWDANYENNSPIDNIRQSIAIGCFGSCCFVFPDEEPASVKELWTVQTTTLKNNDWNRLVPVTTLLSEEGTFLLHPIFVSGVVPKMFSHLPVANLCRGQCEEF